MFFRYNLIFRRARGVRLSPEEKNAQKREILAFMEAHPVREAALARPLWHGSRMRFALASLGILCITVGAGTVSAAERALPTEFLYPVKIHVNEPLSRALARTPEAKAELDTRIAVRRLEEARDLAEGGRLTTTTEIELAKRFEVQTGRIDASFKALRKEGKPEKADRLTDRLEQAVERQERVAKKRRSDKSEDVSDALFPTFKKGKERIKRLREKAGEEQKETEPSHD